VLFSRGDTANETWAFDGISWQQINTAHTPPNSFPAMAYDEHRDRIVLFGGAIPGVYVNDTWEFDGQDWIQVSPLHAPSPRKQIQYGMTYDSIRQRIVLFGGCIGNPSTCYGDTWEYDGADWTQINTSVSPAARGVHSMVFDAARGKTVLFSGYRYPSTPSSANALHDMWEYDGQNWTQVNIALPPPRGWSMITYDNNRSKIILFGGIAPGSVAVGDTWEFDGAQWQQIYGAASPSPRFEGHLAYHASQAVVLLQGGQNYTTRFDDFWQGSIQADTTPPATITDLTAAAGGAPGEVSLRWTAPGDDGQAGTASTYIVRYDTVSITEASWDSASDVIGEPAPSPAGSAESMIVSALTPGQNYYFALKAQDEVPNTSSISNSPSATARSTCGATGDLDPSFGGDGKVTTAISGHDYGTALAIQDDGKLVVVGVANSSATGDDFAVVRYNTDGTLDSTFGGDGKVTTNLNPHSSRHDRAEDVDIQDDGKIVVVGMHTEDPCCFGEWGIVRYRADGTPDITFDSDGIKTIDIGSNNDRGRAVAVQDDGKIVVAGEDDNGGGATLIVARLTSNGDWDTTFGGDGKVGPLFGNWYELPRTVLLPDDGKIVVAGHTHTSLVNGKWFLVRYKTNGDLDPTFGTGGKVTTNFGGNDISGAAVLQGDGKIVMVGYTNAASSDYRIAVARYNHNGTLDTTFGDGGKVTTDLGSEDDFARGVAIQTDGKIVVAGQSGGDFIVLRYNGDGTLDTTFGNGGMVSTDFDSGDDWGADVIIQEADGKIAMAGSAQIGTDRDFAVARYLVDLCLVLTVNQGSVTVDEGQIAVNHGTVSYSGGDTITLGASVGTAFNNGDGTWSWSFPTSDGPGQSQTVTLTADDGNGGIAEISFELTVNNVAPTATFGNDGPVDEGSSFTLYLTAASDPSTTDTTAGFEYAFDCGDDSGYGAFSAINSATCPTEDNGTRNVKGKIQDKDGGVTEYTTSVTVLDLEPTAAFTWGPEPQDEGSTVNFADASASFPDAIVSWAWDFDGLDTSTDQNPSFTFMDDGTYDVCLTVTDIDGSTDSVCHTATVLDLGPTAAFTWAPEPQDEGSPINFADASTSYPDEIVAWAWDFGGLGTSTAQNPNFTFMDDGAYDVCLMVTDDDGSTDTVCHVVTVLDLGPTAAFTWAPEPQHEGSPIGFTDASTSYPDDIFVWAWDFAELGTSSDQDPSFTFVDDGTYPVCLTVSDDDSSNDTVCHDVTVDNVAPTATFGNDGPVDEGSSFVLSLTDPFDPSDADTAAGLTYAFDCGDGGGYGTFSASSSATCPTSDDGIRTVRGKIKDKNDGVTEYTASVEVYNVAPTIESVTGPVDPIDISDQPISVEVTFSDPGTADTHDVTWDWGDASDPDTQTNITSPASQDHTYDTPGVYVVTGTVTDDDGGSDTQAYEFIVIYDSDGGFVTGGGWIISPPGACQFEDCTYNTTGKASFGFVSKYKNGASAPTGQTEFQFKAGNLNFHSDSYDWLVIAGANAKYKGVGTINGAGAYGFMLTATDADLTPSTDVDLFRIKIWIEENDAEIVIYDNKIGEPDDGYAGTEIGGGSIKIHQAK
jgi:uncharacterized delta-60 repeat protein